MTVLVLILLVHGETCGIRFISLKGAGCGIIACCLHRCSNALGQSCLPLINCDVYVFKYADDNVKDAYQFKRSVPLWANIGQTLTYLQTR